jgi:hypothetical protein
VKVQVSGQVLSQSQAARLVIGQARGRVKSLKEPLCLAAAFEDGKRIRRGDGQGDDSYTHAAGRPRTM